MIAIAIFSITRFPLFLSLWLYRVCGEKKEKKPSIHEKNNEDDDIRIRDNRFLKLSKATIYSRFTI